MGETEVMRGWAEHLFFFFVGISSRDVEGWWSCDESLSDVGVWASLVRSVGCFEASTFAARRRSPTCR